MKERLKGLAKQKHVKHLIADDDIDAKISILNSYIKNCEIDLSGHFRGNITIESKLNLLKLQRQQLQNEKQQKQEIMQQVKTLE